MTILYVSILIASFVFQAIYSKKKYHFILNPILIFNVIFFLHNWSLAFAQIIDPNILGTFIPNNSYDIYKEKILLINITCLWAFFFGVIMFNDPQTKHIKKHIKYNFKIYNVLYYTFVLFSFIYVISTKQYSATYGLNQAKDATVAFNPIGLVSVFRYTIGCIVVLSNNKKTKKVIALEILFSIITGGRKNIVSVLIAFVLSKYEYKKIKLKIKHFIIIPITLIIVAYFIVFMTEFRIIKDNTNMSFVEKIAITNVTLKKQKSNFFLHFISAANSEGVQAWTYYLLEKQDLTLTFGMSYVQGIVNTVVLRPFQGTLVNYQAAYYFKKVAYPNVNNHGWDYSFSAEAILNWGQFAFISYFLLGLFINYANKKRKNNNYYDIFYKIIISTLFINLRTDSTGFFRIISIYVITFFALRYFNIIKKTIRIKR